MAATARKPYATDLTDAQWEVMEPLIPAAKHGGRHREVDMREVVNTLRYLVRTGCQWGLLPHDLLPKSTVYDYFARWRDDGTWQRLVTILREAVREQTPRREDPAQTRAATPSAACVDSQSIKTAGQGGACGNDGGKLVHGRKRHIYVDTLGLLLAALVTAANVDDAAGAGKMLEQLKPEELPRLEAIFGDNKFHNHAYYEKVKTHSEGRWRVIISSKPEDKPGFVPLPLRWAVERTFAWFGRYRRNSKDYERRTDSSECMLRLSAISLMLRRLRPPGGEPAFHYPKSGKTQAGK